MFCEGATKKEKEAGRIPAMDGTSGKACSAPEIHCSPNSGGPKSFSPPQFRGKNVTKASQGRLASAFAERFSHSVNHQRPRGASVPIANQDYRPRDAFCASSRFCRSMEKMAFATENRT